MLERLSNGWELAKESFHVLMLDKEMLVFPLLSGLLCLLVLASFGLPLAGSDYLQQLMREPGAPHEPVAYVIAFAFYFANYFVIVYFNSAMIACAIIRFSGGDPTLADGFRAATARLPQIFAWALVSATVGVILRVLQSRSKGAGRVAGGLMGTAWGIATYFVVPALVVERVGPIDAVKRSLAILRNTWGEALAGNFGIGLITFLLCLIALVPAAAGFLLGTSTSILAGIAVTVVLLVVVSLVSSAANAILLAALYQYAAADAPPPHFDEYLLQTAFVQR